MYIRDKLYLKKDYYNDPRGIIVGDKRYKKFPFYEVRTEVQNDRGVYLETAMFNIEPFSVEGHWLISSEIWKILAKKKTPSQKEIIGIGHSLEEALNKFYPCVKKWCLHYAENGDYEFIDDATLVTKEDVNEARSF